MNHADLYYYDTIIINNIIYLPHYADKNIYVSPGYGQSHFKEYKKAELVLHKDAKIKKELLWKRAWDKQI